MATFADIRNTMFKIDPKLTISNELIGRIKGIREKEGISQSELSRRSGVPQKTISRMENGLSTPSLDTLYKLIESMEYELKINISKN